MIGLVSLVAQGVRARARTRSHQEFLRASRERMAIPDEDLLSATAPVHGTHLEQIRAALTAAVPAGWAVTGEELITVSSPDGPQLVVEVEKPGCSSRRGQSEGATVPTYWLIAPVGPTVTVLAQEQGGYVERARVTTETWTTDVPLQVTLPLQAR